MPYQSVQSGTVTRRFGPLLALANARMLNRILGRIQTALKSVFGLSFDTFDILRAGHMSLEGKLLRLRLMRNPDKRKALLAEIRAAIMKHASLEEDIFYPACEGTPGLKRVVTHALTGHKLTKLVVDDLSVLDPAAPRHDISLRNLSRKLEQHVREEEGQLFRLVRRRMSRAEFRRVSRKLAAANEVAVLSELK